ncbi:MAG: PTS transporter subunit EIIC [Fusobacterium perfoetens]|uniref:PTS transporter subunit EIIC n=1 Tax=Fusobacterium perfoetens TaxID=852 RepID=UPI0023F0EF50|nr:PTS transporter subunit EIIC [Fusobacterium perfoetens]MCI6152345.1 PTS transporter subunit EIIC [Fusobacterium perfoetens]MDY3236944.1 PTS transporter subunit EIIC [Fusobacterium perfoetens]
MDFNKVAEEVLENIGGKENISVMEHCATRLRIVAKDNEKVNKDGLKKIPGIGGYFYQSGQHQIIIGTGKVNKVFDILNMGDIKNTGAKQEAYTNLNPFQKVLRVLADVFIPLIPVLVATGLCMGLRGFALQLGMKFSPEFLTMTQVVTDTVFIFLPALVVWSAFKRLGGTPVIGMVLGLMLVAPMIPNAWDVASGNSSPLQLGIFKIVGFQGTILPALIVGVFGSKVEKWVKSWMPSVVDLVFTPFLTIIIGILAAFLVIGPIFTIVEHLVMNGVQGIVGLPFGIGGAIFGGIQQALTVTGLHHSLMIVETSYLASEGINPLNALITASMAGQAGAAIAYTMTLKDKNERALKFSSIVPCFFGITEPLLFGVTLSNSKVFISGMIGGAVAGAFAMLFKVAPSVMGVTFIPAIPAYLGNNLLGYVAMIAVGMVVGMVITKILVRKGE